MAMIEAIRAESNLHRLRSRIARIDHRFWFILLLIAATIFVWTKQSEIGSIARSIRTANPRWLALVILLSLAIQLLFSVKFTQILRLLGNRLDLWTVTDAQLQRHAISTVVPGGAVPGSLLFIRRLNAHGAETENVLLGLGVFGILGHLSFVLVLAPTVISLARHGQASPTVEYASVGFTLVVLLLAAILMRQMSPASTPLRIEERFPAQAVAFIAHCRSRSLRARQLIVPLLTALLVDLAGIAMLAAALGAVGASHSLSIAAGGYVVGTLFQMIAPIFQGIGLVEVSMALVLDRLGVGHAQAITATLIYRIGELWLPLLLGLALQARAQPRLRSAPAHLPAILTTFTGLASVLSVMAPHLPHHHDRIEDYSIINLVEASRTIALVGGCCLLILSYALWRRRRIAWLASLVLSAIVGLTHLTKQHDQGVALIAAANVGLLLLYRHRFRVRNDIPSLRRGIIGFAASLVFALLYGTFGFWFLDRRQFGIEFSLGHSLRTSLDLYFSLGSVGLHPHTRYANWFLDSLSIVGVMAILTGFVFLLRPFVWRHRTLPQERAAAADLIQQYGRSSLDAFKTSADKYFFFSHDRQSVIAFGLSTGTAIALGDPVAPTEAAFHEVLAEFLDFADANGWQVAFHQTPPTWLDAYREAGLLPLKIGEEATVDLTTFTVSGNAMKGLRAAVNRCERAGLQTVYFPSPLTADQISRLKRVSDEWLSLPGRREREFTLGQWDERVVRHTPVLAVEDESGAIVAFVNLVADGVPGEATFDLMRHTHDAPSGAMDFLLVRLIERLREDGYTRMSLGMAPWAEVGTDADARLLEKGVGAISPHLGRFFSVSGLRAYKDKFRPQWEPRYLIYQSEAALPRTALAIIRLTERGAAATQAETQEDLPVADLIAAT